MNLDTFHTAAWDPTRSPFAPVLHTNHSPSAEELTRLETMLLQPQQELCRVESEIVRLQSARDRLKAYIEPHRALLSPIRRLPPEMLAEIFISCLPTDRHPVRDLEEAPLLLTLVCRPWRQIAINTPRLWNALHVHVPKSISTDALLRREQGAKLWLERSGSLPLSVSLIADSSPPPDPDTDSSRAPLIRELMQYSHRFKETIFSLGPADFSLMNSLMSDDSEFPLLESFSVLAGFYGIGRLSFMPLLSRVPSPKRLSITGYSCTGAQYLSGTCKWETLTELTLLPGGARERTFGTTDILDILAQTPRLEFCHLSVTLAITDPPMRAVHLPVLHEMRIALRTEALHPDPPAPSDWPFNAVSEIFTAMICPSLKTLCFTWRGKALSDVPIHCMPLQQLDTLALQAAMTPETFDTCLSLAPNITSLEFIDKAHRDHSSPVQASAVVHTLQDGHLWKLSPSPDNPLPLCPRLKNLKLFMRGLRRRTISDAALLTFLESRHRQGMLECCDIFFHMDNISSFSSETLQRLRLLKQDGLRLRISCISISRHVPCDLPTHGLRPKPSSLEMNFPVHGSGTSIIV